MADDSKIPVFARENGAIVWKDDEPVRKQIPATAGSAELVDEYVSRWTEVCFLSSHN